MTDATAEIGEFSPPFEIRTPAAWRAPVIFNSPHSGAIYPEAFLQASRLDLHTLRKAEDSFVDAIIVGLADQGFATMRAHFPRSYVDVNREPYELDPRMYIGRLPSFANTRSMRVAGGLGTIPRVVGDAQEIYHGRITPEEALSRIEYLYKPYHTLAPQFWWTVTQCPQPPTAGTKQHGPISCSATVTAPVAPPA